MGGLRLNTDQYEVRSMTLAGKTITFRAFKDLQYCENPLNPIQKLNLFVPEAYYQNGTINGYNAETAPIFIPNTVGGYMPGPADEPGIEMRSQKPNTLFQALEHGYVAASAGVRGRTSGKRSAEFFVGSKQGETGEETGRMVGRAPALIVDYKAAIRYLRHNQDLFPGNTDYIITNGTSAGGALSALAGATGNSPDYEPYLKEIGAADERDDIFAASCYCPIHNLENADAAYEWMFEGINEFHNMRFEKAENGIRFVPSVGVMPEDQIALSAPLKALFPAYVNSLGLTDENGKELSLEADGEGTFKEFVKSFVIASANKEWKERWTQKKLPWLMTAGSEIEQQDYLTIEDNAVKDLNWDAFVKKITRMKTTPAFDAVDLSSPENEEFGDKTVEARHFTVFSKEHSKIPGAELASSEIIRRMNPTAYIRDPNADTAPHWRIRHGAFDRDTALAIPVILQTLLKNNGYDVDFFLPWGLPHSGDYDTDELFDWIDSLIK